MRKGLDVSMSSKVEAPDCNCDECGPMTAYIEKQKQADFLINGEPVKPGVAVTITESGAPENNGTFSMQGTGSGRLSTAKPNIPNIPRSAFPSPPKSDLEIARELRHKKRHKKVFRVLDHGPRWMEQGCGARFKSIRWNWPNPEEWRRVGWAVSGQHFPNRKLAVATAKVMNTVAEVMDS